MSEQIKPIPLAQIIQKGGIWIENITDGFEQYEYAVLEGVAKNYQEFLFAALEQNGSDNAYVDFYYNRLTDKEKARFNSFLTDEERVLLDCFEFQEGQFFYPLNQTILPFLLKLSEREVLFSTFYFTKYPCTVWGNYGLRFPIFFQGKTEREIYKHIAAGKRLGL